MPGSSNDEQARTLLERWQAWTDAIVANDADRIGSFMSDDWIIVGDNGYTEREEFLSVVASGSLTHEAMTMVNEPRVAMHGDTAVITSRVTNHGHWEGHAFSADEWTTDVFVLRDGAWLCMHSHITQAKD